MEETPRPSVLSLPQEPQTPTNVVAEWLASRFGVDVPSLVQKIGGGWQPVEVAQLEGLPSSTPSRWLGAGKPLQVLLRLSDSIAVVGVPVAYSGGLAGPPSLAVAMPVSVDLAEPRALANLAAAVDDTLGRAREDWGWCQGCRDYLPVSAVPSVAGTWCTGCREQYLLIIAC